MSEALLELIFWAVVFIAFFYGFKWLQNRKKAKEGEQSTAPAAAPASQRRENDDTSDGDGEDGGD